MKTSVLVIGALMLGLAAPPLEAQDRHIAEQYGIKTEPAPPPRLEFRGFYPGMKADDADSIYRARIAEGRQRYWQQEAAAHGAKYANWSVQFYPAGGFKCRSVVDGAVACDGSGPSTATFLDGLLVDGYWILGIGENYAEIRRGLVEKFGEPKVSSATYQNAYGAKYEGEQLTWERGDAVLTLNELGPRVTQSSLLLMDLRLYREYQKRTQGKPDI